MSEDWTLTAASAGEASPRSVLVTGANTGIGLMVIEVLAAAGHRVYAGARSEQALRTLAELSNVVPVRLDVTEPGDIDAAVSLIASREDGLYGLVNNAGIATVGSVSDGDEQEFKLTMTVNAMAPYCVTRAFAPLLRVARGRIVMIGSIAGILAQSQLAAYSMSKHALEALTDVLAAEMGPAGVRVSIIEPGRFRTELASNARQRIGQRYHLPDLSACRAPVPVAHAICRALFERRPKRRYLVADEAEARETIAKQIEQLVQLNEDHACSYTRDTLVTMLAEALDASEASQQDR